MKKGFTLIELLAVIVILAVIALIATPVVLNIIDDSKENSTIRSAEGYLRSVEYEIAKTYATPDKITNGTFNVLSNGDICIDGYSNNTCTGKILEIDYNNEGPIKGTITLEDAKIKKYELTYSSGIMVADGEIGGIIGVNDKVCNLTLDVNDNGTPDTGDIIKCSNESFHVISNDGDEIKMFARYNLDVSEGGTGLQSSTTNSTVAYGAFEVDDGSGYTEYYLPSYMNQYKNYLESIGVEVNEVASPHYCISDESLSNFTYTNYWTSNETGECAYGEGVHECTIDGNEDQICWMDNYMDDVMPSPHETGVRPIITVSVTNLKLA